MENFEINDLVFSKKLSIIGIIIYKDLNYKEILLHVVSDNNSTKIETFNLSRNSIINLRIKNMNYKNMDYTVNCIWDNVKNLIKVSSQTCKKCEQVIDHAVPNQPDKSFICYDCYIKE
jgi:hypothetical protein